VHVLAVAGLVEGSSVPWKVEDSGLPCQPGSGFLALHRLDSDRGRVLSRLVACRISRLWQECLRGILSDVDPQ